MAPRPWVWMARIAAWSWSAVAPELVGGGAGGGRIQIAEDVPQQIAPVHANEDRLLDLDRLARRVEPADAPSVRAACGSGSTIDS